MSLIISNSYRTHAVAHSAATAMPITTSRGRQQRDIIDFISPGWSYFRRVG
jgi:hypothetical protein